MFLVYGVKGISKVLRAKTKIERLQPYDLGPSFGLDWMVVRVREDPAPWSCFPQRFRNVACVGELHSIGSVRCVIEQKGRAVDPLAGSLSRLASLARCDAGVTVAWEPIRDP